MAAFLCAGRFDGYPGRTGGLFPRLKAPKRRPRHDPAGDAAFCVRETVSRVLSLAVIYLDGLLPGRSSHLLRTAGPALCPPAVLLRIEFTASVSLQPMGELLPRLSTLTWPPQAAKRYISVALFLKSPSAGVTRYPCPVEPGLSS